MFAADQERAAAELARVTRSGGRIGLANWTPDSFVGAMFRTVGKHVPPPRRAEVPRPLGQRAPAARAVRRARCLEQGSSVAALCLKSYLAFFQTMSSLLRR